MIKKSLKKERHEVEYMNQFLISVECKYGLVKSIGNDYEKQDYYKIK